MEIRTSVTLLEQLRKTPADAASWEVFVDRYGPIILGWCRKWGLQEADALDVSQVVLATLAKAMRTFDYFYSRSYSGGCIADPYKTRGRAAGQQRASQSAPERSGANPCNQRSYGPRI
jgi:hypothetical protein